MCVLNCFPVLELGLFSEEVCLISRQGCAERGRGDVAAASQKRRPSTVSSLVLKLFSSSSSDTILVRPSIHGSPYQEGGREAA